MHILPEWNKPYILDSLTCPVIAEYYWAFSGPMLDFTLLPINYLEETIGPAIELQINGTTVLVPSTWNIMVADPETSTLDVVPITNCALNDYHAVLIASYDSKIRLQRIQVTDLVKRLSCVHPMLPKGTMMMNPVGPEKDKVNDDNILSMCIGPYDLYSKYLNNKTIGDLI